MRPDIEWVLLTHDACGQTVSCVLSFYPGEGFA